MIRTFLMGALATMLFCCGASGAEVELLGPAGTAVAVDGQAVGALPLPTVLTLPPGEYVIEGNLRGAETFTRPVTIRDDGSLHTVHLRMRPLKRSEAAFSSLLLAGSGQRAVGRSRLGLALTAAEVGGLLAALVGELNLQNHTKDYDTAQASYLAAVSETELAATRAEVTRLSGKIDDAASMRNVGVALAVGAVAVSVLDVLLRFPGLDAGLNLDTVGPFETPDPLMDDNLGVRLGLSLEF